MMRNWECLTLVSVFFMQDIHTYPRLLGKRQFYGGTHLSLQSILELGKDKILESSKAVGRVYAWREDDDGSISDIKCSTGFYVSRNLVATSRHIMDSFPSLNFPNKYSFLPADFCPFSEQAGRIGTLIQPIQEDDNTYDSLDFKCFAIARASDEWFLPSERVMNTATLAKDRACYSLQYNGDVTASEIKAHYETEAMKDKVPIPRTHHVMGRTLNPNSRSVGIGICNLRGEFGLLVSISLNYGASGGPVCLLQDDALRFIAVVFGRSETANSNRAEPTVYDPSFMAYYKKYIRHTL